MRRRPLPATPPSTFPLRDVLAEAVGGVLQRPGRTVLTLLGTTLGVGAFVAVLGLTATAAGQISSRFTALVATEVSVEEVTGRRDPNAEPAFPPDAEARVCALNGVRHAGVYRTVSSERVGPISGVLIPGADNNDHTAVIAASPGLVAALHPTIREGRIFDDVHDGRAEHVAILGSAAARRLGISSLQHQPVVFAGGVPLVVVGILADVERRPEVLMAVLVPWRTAESLWGAPDAQSESAKMLIDTKLGAASVIAKQVAVALRPDGPDLFAVVPPPDPKKLHDDVGSDLSMLFLLLAGISLVIGTVSIANTTLVAVLERVPEIGLRRALGARRRHIGMQFLSESGLLGAIGGLVGTSLGVCTVVVVAASRDWTPIMETWTVVAAPPVGVVTGVLAGLGPAIQAARIEPVEALRH